LTARADTSSTEAVAFWAAVRAGARFAGGFLAGVFFAGVLAASATSGVRSSGEAVTVREYQPHLTMLGSTQLFPAEFRV